MGGPHAPAADAWGQVSEPAWFATRFPEATWHRPTECQSQQWDVVGPSKGGSQDGALWTQPGCVLFSRDPRATRAVGTSREQRPASPGQQSEG